MYSPLLSGAAVAGHLNDCVSLIVGSVDGLETFAVRGANQLDNGVFGPGRCSNR